MIFFRFCVPYFTLVLVNFTFLNVALADVAAVDAFVYVAVVDYFASLATGSGFFYCFTSVSAAFVSLIFSCV